MMTMHRSAADIVVETLTPVKVRRNDFYITMMKTQKLQSENSQVLKTWFAYRYSFHSLQPHGISFRGGVGKLDKSFKNLDRTWTTQKKIPVFCSAETI